MKGYLGVAGMIVFKTETGKRPEALRTRIVGGRRIRDVQTSRHAARQQREQPPAVAVGKTRLHVELLDERSPFLEGIIVDGVFHLTGFLCRDFGIYPQVLSEELQQQLVAAENRGTVFVAFLS